MGLVAQAGSHLQAVFRRGAIPHLFAAYGRHQLEIAPAGNVVGPARVNRARKVAYLMRISRRKFIEKRHLSPFSAARIDNILYAYPHDAPDFAASP